MKNGNTTLPLISVIVPVYNAEKTLRECVDSILSQDFRDYELLLIDDGSRDDSPQICDEYAAKDSRVKVFHKENGGVSAARNLGIDNAQGKWITFIDSDDYITAGYFDRVIHQKEDLLIHGYTSFDRLGERNSKRLTEFDLQNGFSNFLNRNITDTLMRGPVFKFYQKGIIGDLRFLPDMKIGEDSYFVFKYLANCQSCAILPDSTYMVRLADKPDEVKYAITTDYAIQSLKYLKEAFDGLVQAHSIDKSRFLSYIGYFKRISQSDWKEDKMRWYGNKEVKTMYGYVWPALSAKQKLQISLARVFKR